MTGRNCSIFLGDVVAAIRELTPVGPDADKTQRLIAELLGFESGAPPHESAATVAPAAPPRPEEKMPELPKGNLPKPNTESGAAEPAPGVTRWRPSTMQVSRAAPARDAAALLADFKPLPAAQPPALDEAGPQLSEPLFAPAWSRAIFSTLLATWREGEIDFPALVEKVARHEVIERLPTGIDSTLHRGVQVLVDTSIAMTPFAADQAWALGKIESVAGREVVQVLSFTGLPTRGVMASLFEDPRSYAPPPPGTAVLLLSDLGIGQPAAASERASVEEWATFARAVRRADCPLVALLPYGCARWPRALRGLISMAHWDPRTTVGRVRAASNAARPPKVTA